MRAQEEKKVKQRGVTHGVEISGELGRNSGERPVEGRLTTGG
jgi:hypothetical protein